ncbi:MAG: hypothetical protein ACYCXW_05130 [Solirubrobacteraceae bacterium]
MEAQLWLHIRVFPGGRVIATPVPFCDLSRDGGSVRHASASFYWQRSHSAKNRSRREWRP